MRLFNQIIISVALIGLSACTQDKGSNPTPTPIDNKGYPKDVAAIMLTKCATPGCHTDQSAVGASGLSLTSWDNLFKGTNAGATVVPYRTICSPLLAFVNTYPDYGVSILPTMPFNSAALTKAEVKIINDWIVQGAPNDQGQVKFADNATSRPKYYVANQGCDLISVFDRQSGILMRCFDVGLTPAIESPHMIKKSPDGHFGYAVFYTTGLIQQFSTETDAITAQLSFAQGGLWSTFDISPDGKLAVVADWEYDGMLAIIDLTTMKLLTIYKGGGLFYYPHGIAFNKSGRYVYVTAQTGNFIYKVDLHDINNFSDSVVVLEPKPKTNLPALDPHFISFTPDGSEYYITCQHSNEVRCFKAANDSLLAVIPTGHFPQELEFSTTSNYLFVTCTEDSSAGVPQYTKGSVAVIDYRSHSLVKNIYGFYQPHGIGVSDKSQKVYVASRNRSVNGPAPHHSTSCAGRNGYIQAIDMNTLMLVPGYKPEVTVDPYSIFVKE